MNETHTILGTMTFGDTVDAEGAAELVSVALDAGITSIDTANVYSDGESERLLGRILPADRSELTIATKVGIPHRDAHGLAPLSAEAIRLCVSASMERLRTERIDLLYLHSPDHDTPLEETVEALLTLVDDGSVGRIGVSNFAAWQIEQIRHLVADTHVIDGLVAQQLYSPVARQLEDEYSAFALARRLPTYAYNPLAGGILTGRHRLSEDPSEGRFGTSRLGEFYRNRYWNEPVFDAVRRLDSVAADAGIGLAELSLRWVAFAPFIDGVVLGGSRPEHIVQNTAALAQGPLPEELRKKVSAATDPLRGTMLAYNR